MRIEEIIATVAILVLHFMRERKRDRWAGVAGCIEIGESYRGKTESPKLTFAKRLKFIQCLLFSFQTIVINSDFVRFRGRHKVSQYIIYVCVIQGPYYWANFVGYEIPTHQGLTNRQISSNRRFFWLFARGDPRIIKGVGSYKKPTRKMFLEYWWPS